MVYHLSGGNTDYDPTLGELPSTYFSAMDGDISKVEIADVSPDGGGLIMARTYAVGRPLQISDAIPTKLLRGGPGLERAKLLDINFWQSGIGLVNESFKDIIEEFEPDIHQFFPMEFFDASGKNKIGEGYWMIICQRLDTLHENLCFPPRNAKGFIDRRNPAYADREKSLDRIVFSKDKVAGHHVWHDKFLRGNFFSNPLAQRLVAAQLTGLSWATYNEE